MIDPHHASRLDPWMDPAAVQALHRALLLSLPDTGSFALYGAAAPAWSAILASGVHTSEGSDEPQDVSVVCSPDALPANPAEEADFVAGLVRRSNAALLATCSPASAIGFEGRWPRIGWIDSRSTAGGRWTWCVVGSGRTAISHPT